MSYPFKIEKKAPKTQGHGSRNEREVETGKRREWGNSNWGTHSHPETCGQGLGSPMGSKPHDLSYKALRGNHWDLLTLEQEKRVTSHPGSGTFKLPALLSLRYVHKDQGPKTANGNQGK